MLLFDGGFALIAFAIWVFCIIDVITTPESECRNLPKMVWLLIVIILVDVGSIAWLVAGRNWNARPADLPYKGNRGRAPEPRRTPRASNPDDDDEFLANLRARAEEQRRRARDAGSHDDPPSTPPTA